MWRINNRQINIIYTFCDLLLQLKEKIQWRRKDSFGYKISFIQNWSKAKLKVRKQKIKTKSKKISF